MYKFFDFLARLSHSIIVIQSARRNGKKKQSITNQIVWSPFSIRNNIFPLGFESSVNFRNQKLYKHINRSTFCKIECVFSAFDSPVIKPDDKERVITARNNFTLECTGKYPMTWSFPDNPPTDDNEPAESHISTREPTETDETYGIRLDLYNVTGADVGRYYCLRNTTDSNKDISLAELENNGEAKSIYLYVDGKCTICSDGMLHTFKPYKCRESRRDFDTRCCARCG